MRLSYRLTRRFRGKPGVELITIGKAGLIGLRQILREPRPMSRLWLTGATLGVVVIVGGVLGGLAGAGVFSSTPPVGDGNLAGNTAKVTSVTVVPDAPTQLVSPDSGVTVQLAAGTVDRPMVLQYRPLYVDQLPPVTEGFVATNKVFDLSLTDENQRNAGPLKTAQLIIITIVLDTADIALAQGGETNLVIQHYNGGSGWTQLPTTVDFVALIAQTQVDNLSIFALTIRETELAPTTVPEPTSITSLTPTISTLVPSTSPTPTSAHTPTVLAGPTATATIVPTVEPTSLHSPTPVFPVAPTSTPIPVPTPTPRPVAEYLLETAISPVAWGSLEAVPESDDDRYPRDTVVVVTAQCGLDFVIWAGDVPEGVSAFNNSLTVTMDRDLLLVALCVGPTPTPAPTPILPPVPTPTPGPQYSLSINGFAIGAGQSTLAVGNGSIVLSQPADADGTYLRNTVLTLLADTEGLAALVIWSGVDSKSGNQATLRMAGPRSISVVIIPTDQPTPTPGPLPQLEIPSTTVPTPVPTPSPAPVGPSVITKTSDSDDGACDADCSLREAIAAATSGDTIVIPAGTYTLSLGSEIAITKSLTISGAGATSTIIQASIAPFFANTRVINIQASPIEVSGVTVRYGNDLTGSGGGGVLVGNQNVVTLNNAVVSDNNASQGGGLSNSGILTLNNSTVSGNQAGSGGGGIYNSSTLTMTNSTVSDNSGEGIYNIAGSSFTATSTTISGNVATNGGAIFNQGTVSLTNVTISSNSAAQSGNAGGIAHDDAIGVSVSITNTIIANSY